MSPTDPPPTSLIGRFGVLVEGLKRAIAEGIGREHARLGPTAVLLWNYLARTLRRLAALHARMEAGKLAAPSRRRAAPRRVSDHPARLLPPGVVLAQYRAGHFCTALRELVEDPAMRSLLVAAPQAGRLLRPLWRMLTADKLPEALRLPPRPRRRKPPIVMPSEPDAPDAPAAAVRPPDTMTRPRRAAPAEPWVPEFRLPPFSAA